MSNHACTEEKEVAQGATKVLLHFEAERGDVRQHHVLTAVDDSLQGFRERDVVVDVLVGHCPLAVQARAAAISGAN
jgi:hypothetical protein